MALVQMRTPGGSYSMVDEKLVPVYEAEGWVLTSDLPEFKTKDVTYYDEARKTVVSSKGEEKPVEEVVEKKVSNKTQDTKSVDVDSVINNASGKIRTLTTAEYNEFKKLPIEEKRIKIAELAAANINFRSSQIEDLEKTYRITEEEFNAAVDKGRSGELDVMQSGPLNSGVDTWWQLLGYDTINEVNKDLASGALNINDPEVRRAKDNAQEKRGMGGVNDTRTQKPFGPQEFSDVEGTVTVFKDGKAIEVLQSDLHLYELQDWTTDESAVVSTDTSSIDSSTDSSSNVLTEKIGETQVVVYGPNGARTTANTFKRPGEEMSEYDRLIAGLIPGREGYKNATKSEPLTSDYPGDYGGEDASTPMDQRESVVGVGNTGYDTKDYSSVGNVVGESSSGSQSPGTGSGQFVGQPGSNQDTVFNNIPTGAKVFDVDGDYYLGYLVPGGDGSLYTGSIYMMYQVPNNDFVKSGLLTDASAFKGANSFLTKEDLNTGGAIVAGTTVELEGIEGNPFLQFVERINDNVAISPWLATADGLALSAEVALEGRDPTPGEYRQLKWFQETTEEQRDWYELSLGRGFNNLPLDAKQAYENTRRNVKNNLLSLGIAGGFDPETGMLRDVPPGLVDYISQKAVTGEWSESKTTEQLRLFADPFAAGERDEAFFNVVEASGYDQIDRQMQYEDTVRQEALKWLGPVAGNYNSTWVANWGSRLRSGEADAFQQLQTMLKQQRVALFDAYTNPELTYEDISQPWKNIVENAWGEVPDESQTYFQDIVKNNNVTYANEVLTKVGLEQGNDKVVNDALNSLEQSIGQGTVRRNLGANT
jgi:hypothetical protein